MTILIESKVPSFVTRRAILFLQARKFRVAINWATKNQSCVNISEEATKALCLFCRERCCEVLCAPINIEDYENPTLCLQP